MAVDDLRDADAMIELTFRDYADSWPPIERTGAGPLLLTSRGELAKAQTELSEALTRLHAGEDLECSDELLQSARDVHTSTRRLLDAAVRERAKF